MDNRHFNALTRSLAASLTRRRGLGVVASASLPLLGMAQPAIAGKKQKKVTLCLNGQTVKKPKKKAKKLQKQGASEGSCRCGNGGACFAFVTEAGFTGSSFSSIAGADASCQEAASDAGLPGTYKAWLSAGGSTPVTRFTNTANAGPYVLVGSGINSGGPKQGALVANSFAELLACSNGTCQANPISVTEKGELSPQRPVWTGTRSDGTAATDTCNGWNSDAALGLVGDTNLVNSQWTDNGTRACDEPRPVFCFQQAT